MSKLSLSLIMSACIALAACGGGGGASSTDTGTPPPVGGGTPTNPTTPTNTIKKVRIKNLQVSTKDVLATVKQSQKVAVLGFEWFKKIMNHATDVTMSTAYADDTVNACVDPVTGGTSELCGSGVPAVVPTTQLLSYKINAGGVLSTMAPIFTKVDNADAISCDFKQVNVYVEKMYLLDDVTKNALVTLSTPTGVDSTCNLMYELGDYVVLGSTHEVIALKERVTLDIKYMIAANNQAFNTSTNPIYVSQSTGIVRELSIDVATGAVSRTDLTAASQPVGSGYGNRIDGQVAYDGTYLVQNGFEFSGLQVFKKGETSFKALRDTSNMRANSVFINDEGQFITRDFMANNNDYMILNPQTGESIVWAASAQKPVWGGGGLAFSGRFGKIVGGNRCDYWDYGNSTMYNLFPKNTLTSLALPATSDEAWNYSYFPFETLPVYSRLENGQMFCVNGSMSQFTRHDVTTKEIVTVNLDNFGYLVSKFEIFAGRAYATVTNTADSSVQYIEIDLVNGTAKYLGTISVGSREVVDLVKSSNGG